MNSTNSDGPQIISDFYMTVLIESIKQNGYQIFVVEGELPVYDPNLFKGNLKKTQFYFTVEQIKKTNEKRNKEKNNELNLSGYDARDMNKLLERERRMEQEQFKGDYYGGQHGDEEHNKPQEKPQEKKFFEGKGVTLSGQQGGGRSVWYEGDDDQDTLQAVLFSLKEVRHAVTNVRPME